MKRFFLCVLGVYLFCVGLNLLGFCPQKMRFVSDDDLINAVLVKKLPMERGKEASIEEVLAYRKGNPLAGHVARWNPFATPSPWMSSLVFQRRFEVSVVVPHQSYPEQMETTLIRPVTACGEISGAGLSMDSHKKDAGG